MVSNVETLESVQSIAYALSLSNVSFSPETFVEISAALSLVGFIFHLQLCYSSSIIWRRFISDLTTKTFFAAPAALDWFLFFSSDRGHESIALCAFP